MRKPVWDVVATVDEPGPLVLAFAAHTLSLGPRCVHLYLDRPSPVVEAALGGMDRIKLTVCTNEHWAKSARRMRPPLHVGRQKENARQVYESTPAEWMVSIDADEFLSSGADLQADLAEQGDDVTFMRIAVRERVMLADAAQSHIFDGVFRKPITNFKLHGPEIYGIFSDYLRNGMTGHAIGKSAFRTGRGLAMCLHAPLKAPIGVTGARAFLRHFDGLTPLHYALKLMRRVREPKMKGKPRHGTPRLLQMQSMAEFAQDADSLRELVEYLKTLRPSQVQALRGLGALDEAGFDPGPALAQFGLAADFSVAAFDAELRARDAGLLLDSGLGI